MRVLLAFDKFKDSLRASQACGAAAAALRAVRPDWTLDFCPLTDGGDGFATILTQAVGGELRSAKVTGPRGRPAEALYGWVPVARLPRAARALLGLGEAGTGAIAVIEMAQASGLALLPPEERDPWETTSRGTGELIRAAADAGAAAILLGVGGSATHDVGLGALSVLGLSCREIDGKVVRDPTPRTWAAVAGITGEVDAKLPPVFVACDVQNPLMGTFGAASVFAPQKGLRPEDFTRLEYMTGRMAALLTTLAGKHPLLCDTPGVGAAGGIAFGLHCAAGAKIVGGYALVSAWLGLEERITAADVVLTGEGSFDLSSVGGKGPAALARAAANEGRRVHVFAGRVSGELSGVTLHAITPDGVALPEALAQAEENLRAAVERVFAR